MWDSEIYNAKIQAGCGNQASRIVQEATVGPNLTLEKTKKTIRQKKLLENNTTSCKEMIVRSLLWKKSDMESSTGGHPDQRSDHSMFNGTIILNACIG